ncbi:MAG: bacterioferritin [Proteobacteria bacterium]|nr:MAG: bacterioferritin [Pseudomonadota bacterium]
MYVCICHGITEKDIQKAARSGVNSISKLASETGATTGCGSCLEMAEDILQQHASQNTDFLQILTPSKPYFA